MKNRAPVWSRPSRRQSLSTLNSSPDCEEDQSFGVGEFQANRRQAEWGSHCLPCQPVTKHAPPKRASLPPAIHCPNQPAAELVCLAMTRVAMSLWRADRRPCTTPVTQPPRTPGRATPQPASRSTSPTCAANPTVPPGPPTQPRNSISDHHHSTGATPHGDRRRQVDPVQTDATVISSRLPILCQPIHACLADTT